MDKKILEILDTIEEKKVQLSNLLDAKKLTEAKALSAELDDLQSELTTRQKYLDNKPQPAQLKPLTTPENDAVAQFVNSARGGFRNTAGYLQEGSDPDGGYTVPEDIQTKINYYRDAKFSLSQLVTVEPTRYESGSKNYLDKASASGFEEVGEGGALKQVKNPTFSRVSYKIKKYGGFMPVTNELLADSDARITDVISSWLGDESRVTRNKKIISALTTAKASTYKVIKTLDDIASIVNIDLGSVYSGTSCIITNDFGKQEISTWKDANGRSLLQPVINEPTKLQLAFGSVIIPVKVIPTTDFPNVVDSETTYAPVIIGDLHEAVVLYDRQKVTIKGSDTASVTGFNAFENDQYLFRAIERFDTQIKDKNAYVLAHFATEIA